MSDNLARNYARPSHPAAPQRATEAPRPHIEIVPSREQRKARPKLAYGITAVLGIIAIIAAQLVLSVVTSQGAYEIAALQTQQKEATRDAQAITEDLDRLKSPQFLAANAQALGMVTNANPAYLRLSDGAVLGQPFGEQGVGASGASSLVPNALLAGVPLVTEQAPPAESEAKSATPTPPAAPQAPAELPLQNGIPAPATH
ncbi:hypothetical protein [Microterricola viridarii]|uniref:Cell division protein FtsL n=1 Tax=Microterricola viridarii TaxID=412690 RepID=A0A1H1VYE6_9MICO|nr:hypothetical protein [Microterricola viridarii]SDS89772.1 hypothetical protein SAMN04489834_2388 [Microterricola viridarii]